MTDKQQSPLGTMVDVQFGLYKPFSQQLKDIVAEIERGLKDKHPSDFNESAESEVYLSRLIQIEIQMKHELAVASFPMQEKLSYVRVATFVIPMQTPLQNVEVFPIWQELKRAALGEDSLIKGGMDWMDLPNYEYIREIESDDVISLIPDYSTEVREELMRGWNECSEGKRCAANLIGQPVSDFILKE